MKEGYRGHLTTFVAAALMILLTLFALAGCGGGGGSTTYSLQVSVSGLSGGDNVQFTYNGTPGSVSGNGTIRLVSLPIEANYSVEITQQPFQKICRLEGDYFSQNGIMPGATLTLSLECVPHSNLNDTGVDGNLTIDSLYGRDSFQNDDQLLKRGDGDAGFDFTKLDAAGNELDADAESWNCVRDNHTGLVWEFDATPELYPWGNALNVDPGVSLCGLTGWRLPDRQELISLWHFGIADGSVAVDSGYFSDTQKAYYWTATPASSDATGDYAWAVLFDSDPYVSAGGFVKPVIDEVIVDSVEYVRRVNGSQVTDATSVDSGSGTVVDPRAGLVWQLCDIGQSWAGSDCSGTSSDLNWSEALDAADGEENWRLPDIKELLSLFDLDPDEVTFEPGASYWTLSAVQGDDSEYVWAVNSAEGVEALDVDSSVGVHVRLVRTARPEDNPED